MADPDEIFGHFPTWLSTPTTLVNRFRIKHPDIDSDRYIYVPGNSFKLPGVHAIENVDLNPKNYPYSVDPERESYVYQGPAFLAWPAGTKSLLTSEGPIQLSEFRARKQPAWPTLGRRLMLASGPENPEWPDLPGFCAPIEYSVIPDLQPLYEHHAQTPNYMSKYQYDFTPEAHSDWGKGQQAFWAVSPEMLVASINQVASAAEQKPATSTELSSTDTISQLANATRGLLEPGKTVDQQTADNLVAFFKFRGLPVKVFTTGMSGDGGFGIGGAIERGIVWNVNRGPIHEYTTLSAGLRIGAGVSINPLNFGFWWGASEEAVLEAMQGFSYYQLIGATVGVGLNIILSYTADFLVYGLTISPQIGAEIEVGGELGASYTSFYEPPPETRLTMKMPSGVW